MGQYMNADRWNTGLTIFDVGGCGVWAEWDITGYGIAQDVGGWNQANPADTMDGLYSQMFGAGKVHPMTVGELTPDGDFNGGVNRVVAGLTPGESYLLICWMKYEFRGQQPDQLAFYLGVDATGQTTNGNAPTIDWGNDQIADKAPIHEIFSHVWRTFTAGSSSVSVWLRASHPVSNPSVMVYTDLVEVRQLAAPPGPHIEVWPQQIAVETSPGVSPPNSTFNIRNSGAGTMNYSFGETCSWLSVVPTGGASTGETDTIDIVYDVSGLSWGVHECDIMVTSAEADNSPLSAPHVTLTIGSVEPDFDIDGDVDQEDFGHLQMCLTGAGNPQYDAACQDAKLDEDDDVDEEDLAIFLGCFNGANTPPAPGCAG
jgi:hypothetical protein